MAGSQWQTRHKRAFLEARRVLLAKDRLIIAVLVTAIYITLIWYILGPEIGRDEIYLKLAIAASSLIAFLAIYLWKLWVTKLNPLTIALVLTVAAICGWAYFLYVKYRFPIEWGYAEQTFGLEVNGRLRKIGDPVEISIYGLQFNGRNRSETAIKQLNAWLAIQNKKPFPLYIISDGRWVSSESKGIPARAKFVIGCQMRSDTVACGEFTSEMTAEDALKRLAPFTLTVICDGRAFQHVFSRIDLERQIEMRRTELERTLNRNNHVSEGA